MTRLPPLTYRDVITRLHQAGFVFDHQAKGQSRDLVQPGNASTHDCA